MTPIHGRYSTISMVVGEETIPLLCATDMTYSCTREMIEKTGPASGGVRQKFKRLEEHVSTVTGLTMVDNGDTLTFWYLLQEGADGEEREFVQTFMDEDGNYKVLTGVGLLGSQNINGPVSDFSNCSVEIHWNQIPDLEDIEPPTPSVVQDPLYLTLAEGETSVSHALLEAAGVVILEIQREGTGYDETAGTPGNREFKFTGGTGNGTIAFRDPGNAPGEGIYVLYKAPL